MKSNSTIENYQDDVCVIPAEIKSMQPEDILVQIKRIQAAKCSTNSRSHKSTITLPIHLEVKSHG